MLRAVRHLARERGVRQFLDLGAGSPTLDPIHRVADQESGGAARVVYVDNEPVAVAHAQAELDDTGDPQRHAALNADLRAPHRLWEWIAATGVIDFGQPVAVLLTGVLHFHQPDRVDGHDLTDALVAQYRELMGRGSWLVLSHFTDQGIPPHLTAPLAALTALYDQAGHRVRCRTREQIRCLFGGFELLDPGLTWSPQWHRCPTGSAHRHVGFSPPAESVTLVGVGRKP